MTQVEDQLMQTVQDAIARNTLTLPTLPEIALRIQELGRDENVSAAELASEIAKDPATVVQLIRIANSAAQKTTRTVDNLQVAIARLGIRLTVNIAVGLAMEQVFRAGSRMIDQRLRKAWAHSQDVAAIAHVLSAHCTRLQPEMAMLAGLVHEIGVLPILRIADKLPEVSCDAQAIDRVVEALHPRIGSLVLSAWQFPEEIARVPEHAFNLGRNHEGPGDYGDIITVAVLQSVLGSDHPLARTDRAAVPAFSRLGITPEVDVIEVMGIEDELEASRAMLAAA
ncbi:MAG TPA: HDOD domain-containing protein [Stenotrophobium sp.]|nr:HDOD domain-containing protein [Stenotrophobium sp.]